VLQFIITNYGLMAEYCYRYYDDETGIFRSRTSPQELQQTDRQHAASAAALLDELPALDDYREFLNRHTPFNDPFLHEARVHLNRRDYYLMSAGMYQERDIAKFQRRMRIAHYENRMEEERRRQLDDIERIFLILVGSFLLDKRGISNASDHTNTRTA